MNKILIALILAAILASSCTDNYTSTDYLKQVLNQLDKVESAAYWVEEEAWNPGDSVAAYVVKVFVESYRNQADTTIG
jgi:hypothetical protein